MLPHSIHQKASKYHSQIRKQHLQQIFQQKRSQLQQRLRDKPRINSKITQEFNKELSKSYYTANEEDSTDLLFPLWNIILSNNYLNVDSLSQSINEKQQEAFTGKQQFFRKTMKELCGVVSSIVKQINELNDLEPKKIKKIIKKLNVNIQGRANQSFSLNQQKLFKKVEILTKIFDFVSCLLSQYTSFPPQHQNSVLLFLTQWSSIMVQLTYLKPATFLEPQFQTQLIKDYRQMAINEQLVRFSRSISELSIVKVYPYCLKIIEIYLSRLKVGNLKQNLLSSPLNEQNMEFMIQVLYVVGNILSDFQPVKLHKKQSVQTNFNSLCTLSKQSHPIDYNQLFSTDLSLISLTRLVQNLELLRVLQLQKCIYSSQYEKDFSDKTAVVKNFITLVELSVWFSRLMIVGGWLDIFDPILDKKYTKNQQSYFSIAQISHQYQNFSTQHPLYKERQFLCQLIKITSTKCVKGIINLSNSLKSQSKSFSKKTIQLICQLLLVYELGMNIYKDKEENFILKRYQETKLKQQSQPDNLPSTIIAVRKFCQKQVTRQFLESKVDLGLVDELYIEMLNILQSALLDQDNQNKETLLNGDSQICQLLVECSRGSITCSEALLLPLLILKLQNNHQHMKKSLSFHNLACRLYQEFISSIEIIVPVSICQTEKMIEEDDDIQNRKQFNLKFFYKKYSQSEQSAFNYFLHQLPLKKQEHFYISFIQLLQQSYCFYLHQATINQQSLMVSSIFHHQNQPVYPFVNVDFMNKFLYLVVDQISKFQQQSKVYLEVLRFLKLIISSFTGGDEDLEEFLKLAVENNVHGVREFLQKMTLWESSEVNEEVVAIFQLLEIE